MSDHGALAKRVARDPFFLGWSLARYQARAGVCEAVLAAELRIDVTALNRLRLCRRPDPVGSCYADDVARIAAAMGCDASALCRIVATI